MMVLFPLLPTSAKIVLVFSFLFTRVYGGITQGKHISSDQYPVYHHHCGLRGLFSCFQSKKNAKVVESEVAGRNEHSGSETTVHHEDIQSNQISSAAFHPSVLHYMLDPSKSGLDGKSAFSFMSTIPGASDAIPTEWKMYYFANLHLGLDLNVPESSLDAFRRCMYLNQSALQHLSILIKASSGPVYYPSLCGIELIKLTENETSTFSTGTWAPIPINLRLALSYFCSENFDPEFTIMLAYNQTDSPKYLQQAFFYESVKRYTYDAYVNGWFDHGHENSVNYVREAFRRSSAECVNSPHSKCSMLALVTNSFRISSHVPEQKGRRDLLLMLHAQIDDMAFAQHTYSTLYGIYSGLVTRAAMQNPQGPLYEAELEVFRDQLVQLLDYGMDINLLGTDFVWNHPIRAVIRLGRIEILKVLLNYGLNLHGEEGLYDFVYEAVAHQQYEMLHFLLEQGVSVQKRGHQGDTILHLASTVSALPISFIKLLLKFDSNAWATNNQGSQPVHLFVEQANVLAADFLLYEAGPIPFATPDKWLHGVFLHACNSVYPERILPYFLGGYAGHIDFGATDAQGLSCHSLLEARSNHQDNSEQGSIWSSEVSQLVDAQKESSWDIGRPKGYFFNACFLTHDTILLATMLHRGANIDEVDMEMGIPCLLYAIRIGELRLVKFLVERGATVDDAGSRPSPNTSYSLDHPVVGAAVAGLPFLEAVLNGPRYSSYQLLKNEALFHAALDEAKEEQQTDVVDFLSSMINAQ